MTTALVQFSTGAGSAYVAYRTIERYGIENTVLITANTGVEDYDNWRFAREVFVDLGKPKIHMLRDGRTPMQVGRDVRVVPNNRLAVCSRILKREIIRDFMEATYDPADSIVMLGFDWTEEHRLKASIEPWKPWTIEAPLMEPPIDKGEILEFFASRGIVPPRLYSYGFSHANCGGACVRGGQAQWKLLHKTFPERYAEWEQEEQETRVFLGKNVTILRDRRGGTSTPMSLKRFRVERLEGGGEVDDEDWGACGCFMGEDP
jgi:hypothetical protein